MPRSKALTGKDWTSWLEYVHYEGQSISHHDIYTTSRLAQLPDGLIPPLCAVDATEGKITKLTAYAIDLGGNNIFRLFKKMLTHHFVQAETDGGYTFTIEKNKKGILFQSCRTSEASSPAVVVKEKNGERRNRSKTRQIIYIDENPKPYTVADVVMWIHATGTYRRSNYIHSVLA